MARIVVMGGFSESLINFRGMLLKEMVADGHEVFACAPESSEKIVAELNSMGVKYISVPLDRTGFSPFFDIYSMTKMVKLFCSIQPDIFLGYTIKPVVYGSLAARIAGVPAIFSMITGLGYTFSGSTLKSKVIGLIASTLYRLAFSINKHVFFQNPDDLGLFKTKAILRKNNQAVLINGSGVDVTEYLPTDFPATTSFLLIARLLRDKGVCEYAQAAHIIRQQYPDVKFRLVGGFDPNPNAINKQELDAWQAAGDVEFLGRLPDVRPSISDCSVYVLPSYREGTPRTVLESMAMGRAIITTDAPGCRETVNDGVNGFLIPVRDVNSLVSAMRQFINNPGLALEMGAAGRVIAEDKYDVRKVNAVILKTIGIS